MFVSPYGRAIEGGLGRGIGGWFEKGRASSLAAAGYGFGRLDRGFFNFARSTFPPGPVPGSCALQEICELLRGVRGDGDGVV